MQQHPVVCLELGWEGELGKVERGKTKGAGIRITRRKQSNDRIEGGSGSAVTSLGAVGAMRPSALPPAAGKAPLPCSPLGARGSCRCRLGSGQAPGWDQSSRFLPRVEAEAGAHGGGMHL